MILISKVEKCLEKYNLLNPNNTFIIGFSGGYDSYCLLDIMNFLSKKYGFTIISAHLNHNWRGKEAFDEQVRCQKISMDYGLSFVTETLEESDKFSENDARIARYGFFEKYANIYNAIVLTAHNFNDNAETLIYRIIKGTGISGLQGIPEYIIKNGVKYVRPLLSISRIDIENYCNEKKLIPNIDSSNNSLNYKRNIIRNEIIPLFEKINPLSVSAINSLANLASDNEIIINKIISKYFEDDEILLDKYKKSDKELKLKIIHKFCILKNIEYDKKKIYEIFDFLENVNNYKKRYSLSTNLWLTFNEDKIYTVSEYKTESFQIDIVNKGMYKTPKGKFEIKSINILEDFPTESDFDAIADLSKVGFPLELRTRKDGDIFQPFGMSGKMKLKKFLISRKIPKEKRENLILLTKGSEVLWIVGVGLSEKLRVAKISESVFKCSYKEVKND